ncbi:hypothetical protein GCM10008965_05760 [Methylorubrum aminovorans]
MPDIIKVIERLANIWLRWKILEVRKEADRLDVTKAALPKSTSVEL